MLHSLDEWVHSLSNLWVFILIPSTLVIAVALAPQVRRAVYHPEVKKEVSDGAADAFKSIVTFMVFLLAFSLVLVQGHFHQAEEIVTREANTINTVDRQLARLPGEAAIAARQVLQQYARSIVRDEWPTMAHEQRADETGRLLGEVYGKILAIDTTTNREQSVYHQILVHLDELSDEREHRLESAEEGLGNLYWGTVVGLALLLVVLASLSQATPERAFALGGLICAASLMISLVVILNKPFTGETVVSPSSIERVIRAMGDRK